MTPKPTSSPNPHLRRRSNDDLRWYESISAGQWITYGVQILILAIYLYTDRVLTLNTLRAHEIQIQLRAQKHERDVNALSERLDREFERLDKIGPVRLQVYEAETRQILNQILQSLEKLEKLEKGIGR